MQHLNNLKFIKNNQLIFKITLVIKNSDLKVIFC